MYRELEKVLFTKTAISARTLSLSRAISRDYAHTSLTVVSLMQGALPFTADLIKNITVPMRLNTILVSSYKGEERSSGNLNIQGDIPYLKGENILIIDDILDSGLTLTSLREVFLKQEPTSVKICALLVKDIKRAYPIEPDYYGFKMGEEFVVGYGLDYQGFYRNLPMIGIPKIK